MAQAAAEADRLDFARQGEARCVQAPAKLLGEDCRDFPEGHRRRDFDIVGAALAGVFHRENNLHRASFVPARQLARKGRCRAAR